MPRDFKVFQSLTKHFRSDKDKFQKRFSVIFFSAEVLKDGFMLCRTHVGDASLVYSIDYSTTFGDVWSVPVAVEFSIPTEQSQCGSWVMLVDGDDVRSVVGIHVAGIPGHGIGDATIITVESIEEALGHIPKDAQISVDLDMLIPQINSSIFRKPPDHFDGLPVVARTSQITLDLPTNLVKSPFYELFGECNIAPAALRRCQATEGPNAGHIVDPRALATRKVTNPVIRVHEEHIVDVSDNFAVKLLSLTVHEDISRRIISIEEACFGIEGNKFYAPIDRNHGSGFFWGNSVLTKGKHGKTFWLGSGANKEIHPMLRKAVELRIKMAKENKSPGHIYKDHLKDETRDISKVRMGKTRLFSSAMLDFIVAIKMYFGGFVGFMMSRCVLSECAVGINPYEDWDFLSRRITRHSTRVMDGDFSDYDGSLMPQILWSICDIINLWYSDDNDDVRKVFWIDFVNSVHVNGEYVYYWTHSNPSGNPLTTVINSMYNSIAFRYVYYRAFNFMLPALKEFDVHAVICSYGDDNVINISDHVKSILTPQVIVDGFRELGMTYTSPDKKGLPMFKELNEVSFLKRKFVLENEKYICQLDFETVRQMLYFKKKNMHNLGLGGAIDCFLKELSFYPKDLYAGYVKKLLKFMIEHNLMGAQPTSWNYNVQRSTCESQAMREYIQDVLSNFC
jgi:hypothetical protein